jgi:hypothetical protein
MGGSRVLRFMTRILISYSLMMTLMYGCRILSSSVIEVRPSCSTIRRRMVTKVDSGSHRNSMTYSTDGGETETDSARQMSGSSSNSMTDDVSNEESVTIGFTCCWCGVREKGLTFLSSVFGFTLDLLLFLKFALFSSFWGLKKSSAVLLSDATAATTGGAAATEGAKAAGTEATGLETEDVTRSSVKISDLAFFAVKFKS